MLFRILQDDRAGGEIKNFKYEPNADIEKYFAISSTPPLTLKYFLISSGTAVVEILLFVARK